jgi:hypothetical protein
MVEVVDVEHSKIGVTSTVFRVAHLTIAGNLSVDALLCLDTCGNQVVTDETPLGLDPEFGIVAGVAESVLEVGVSITQRSWRHGRINLIGRGCPHPPDCERVQRNEKGRPDSSPQCSVRVRFEGGRAAPHGLVSNGIQSDEKLS